VVRAVSAIHPNIQEEYDANNQPRESFHDIDCTIGLLQNQDVPKLIRDQKDIELKGN